MAEKKIEVGDEVVVRGEVVWIDDDGTPRVEFRGGQCPIRISRSVLEKERVIKPKAPPRDIPD